jgi:chitodextrinase
MKKFLREKDGKVIEFIIVLALIAALILVLFPGLRAKVFHWHQNSTDHVDTAISQNNPETNPNYSNTITNSDANGGSTNTTTTGGTSDTSNGSNSGTTTDSGSGSGSGSTSDSGTGNSGTISVSHFDEGGMDITCSNSTTDYNFTIPITAPANSTGTYAITIKNNKGWDIWIKVDSITTYNGLSITTDDSYYRKLSDSEQTVFRIGWLWKPADSELSQRGSAKVHFYAICNEPSSTELYTPDSNSPTNFRTTDVTNSSITMQWDKTYSVSEYLVYRNSILVYRGSNNQYTDSNLLPGTNYQYKLYTNVSQDQNRYSYLEQKTTGNPPTPPAPTNLRLYDVSATTFHFAWSGNSSATQYHIYIDDVDKGTTPWGSYIAQNLIPGKTYKVEVAAENTYGSSMRTQAYFKTNDISAISNPANFRMTDHTESKISVAWDPVPGADKYILRAYGSVLYNGPLTSFDHLNLCSGCGVHYYLYAVSGSSTSSGVYKSFATLGYARPTKPSRIQVLNVTNTSLQLQWVKGGASTSTLIKMNGLQVYSGDGTTTTITNLRPNTNYNFQFYAYNPSYTSSDYASVSVFTTNDTYDDVSNFNVTCENADYTQTFDMPSPINPGEDGVFALNNTNNTNQLLVLNIANVDKTGTLFSGSTPVTLDYDTQPFALESKKTFTVPIRWSLPANASSDYKTYTGKITVVIHAKCNN